MVLKQFAQFRNRSVWAAPWLKGFTILELMVAAAVLGVIATFAYSSYAEHVQETRRTAAQAALLELANFMERYYTEHGRYNGNNKSPQLPFTTLPKAGTPVTYRFKLDEVTRQSYKLVATPVGRAQKDDRCGPLSLDHVGRKLPRKTGCWVN